MRSFTRGFNLELDMNEIPEINPTLLYNQISDKLIPESISLVYAKLNAGADLR